MRWMMLTHSVMSFGAIFVIVACGVAAGIVIGCGNATETDLESPDVYHGASLAARERVSCLHLNSADRIAMEEATGAMDKSGVSIDDVKILLQVSVDEGRNTDGRLAELWDATADADAGDDRMDAMDVVRRYCSDTHDLRLVFTEVDGSTHELGRGELLPSSTPELTPTATPRPTPRQQTCMELVLMANDKILQATQAGFDSPRAASLTRQANALLLRAERGDCK